MLILLLIQCQYFNAHVNIGTNIDFNVNVITNIDVNF